MNPKNIFEYYFENLVMKMMEIFFNFIILEENKLIELVRVEKRDFVN